MRATRELRVAVLPVPAPASTRSGPPSKAATARCSSLSPFQQVVHALEQRCGVTSECSTGNVSAGRVRFTGHETRRSAECPRRSPASTSTTPAPTTSGRCSTVVTTPTPVPGARDISTDVVQFGHRRRDRTVRGSVVPADLPDFAKKIMGDTNKIVQNENWTAGGGYVCDLHIEFPGVAEGHREARGQAHRRCHQRLGREHGDQGQRAAGGRQARGRRVEKETLASLDKRARLQPGGLAG